MAKTYVVAHAAVGRHLQGETVTAEEFQKGHEGVDDARIKELVKSGALREATDAEVEAGSASHSDRDASFVEDQSGDEMRARIKELEATVARLEGASKRDAEQQIDTLAEAAGKREDVLEQRGDQIVADAALGITPGAVAAVPARGRGK